MRQVFYILSALILCVGDIYSQEGPETLQVMQTAILEAGVIQDFESAGNASTILIDRNRSRAHPLKRHLPPGQWSAAALARARATRMDDKSIRVCDDICHPSNDAWVIRISSPDYDQSGATVVIEVLTPRWKNTYLVTLRCVDQAWVVKDRTAIRYTNYRPSPDQPSDDAVLKSALIEIAELQQETPGSRGLAVRNGTFYFSELRVPPRTFTDSEIALFTSALASRSIPVRFCDSCTKSPGEWLVTLGVPLAMSPDSSRVSVRVQGSSRSNLAFWSTTYDLILTKFDSSQWIVASRAIGKTSDAIRCLDPTGLNC